MILKINILVTILPHYYYRMFTSSQCQQSLRRILLTQFSPFSVEPTGTDKVPAPNWSDRIRIPEHLHPQPWLAGQPPSPWLQKWHTFGRRFQWRLWSPDFLLLKTRWSTSCPARCHCSEYEIALTCLRYGYLGLLSVSVDKDSGHYRVGLEMYLWADIQQEKCLKTSLLLHVRLHSLKFISCRNINFADIRQIPPERKIENSILRRLTRARCCVFDTTCSSFAEANMIIFIIAHKNILIYTHKNI